MQLLSTPACLFNSFCRGRWQLAFDLLKCMALQKELPNVRTFNAAIAACATASEWQHALLLHKDMGWNLWKHMYLTMVGSHRMIWSQRGSTGGAISWAIGSLRHRSTHDGHASCVLVFPDYMLELVEPQTPLLHWNGHMGSDKELIGFWLWRQFVSHLVW